jgi:hypothetical protein
VACTTETRVRFRNLTRLVLAQSSFAVAELGWLHDGMSRPSASMKTAFILWHTHVHPAGDEDEKLIGVYATRNDAERAKDRAAKLPGFSANPDGFEIDEYVVGKDHWTEGFETAE